MLQFFQELDAALIPFADGQRLDLYLIGRSALIWGYQATFSTKDVDIVVRSPTPLEAKACELFGQNSDKAKELNLYLEFVAEAYPPLPGGYRDRSSEVPGNWRVIRLCKLEGHDLAVTKLKSFRPKDREDLRFLCDQGGIQADKLRQSLEKTWIWDHPKDGNDDRDAAFANLEVVIAYLEGRSRNL